MWWIELGGLGKLGELAVLVAFSAAAQCGCPWPSGGAGRGRWVAQSTVEYALVGALVVIAAAGAMTILGGQLTAVFTNISNTLRTAATGH